MINCYGFERLGLSDATVTLLVKKARAHLHPLRQATFHFKSDVTQMNRYFDGHPENIVVAAELHSAMMSYLGAFLSTLPVGYEPSV